MSGFNLGRTHSSQALRPLMIVGAGLIVAIIMLSVAAASVLA
jgi:hypothetical protein